MVSPHEALRTDLHKEPGVPKERFYPQATEQYPDVRKLEAHFIERRVGVQIRRQVCTAVNEIFNTRVLGNTDIEQVRGHLQAQVAILERLGYLEDVRAYVDRRLEIFDESTKEMEIFRREREG